MKVRTDRFKNAIKHLPTEYRVQKAKKMYRKQHVECELCGVKPSFFGRNNDVHHLIPVHVNPSMACDFTNLITLCRIHHWLVGHMRNWKNFNARCRDTIAAIRKSFESVAIFGK